MPDGDGSGATGKPDSGIELFDASPPHNDPSDAAPEPPSCTTQTLNLLGNPNLDSGQGGGWLEASSGGASRKATLSSSTDSSPLCDT